MGRGIYKVASPFSIEWSWKNITLAFLPLLAVVRGINARVRPHLKYLVSDRDTTWQELAYNIFRRVCKIAFPSDVQWLCKNLTLMFFQPLAPERGGGAKTLG